MSCRSQSAHRPEDKVAVAAILAERDGFGEQPLTQPRSPGGGHDQEPAKVSRLRRSSDDGDAADDLALSFSEPEPLPVSSRAHELGERASDTSLEGRIEAVLPGAAQLLRR
jgi:hypothetical protein